MPWRAAPDFDEQDLPATFPRLVGKKGFAQLMINMEDLFIATAPAQLDDVRAEWGREPWDALVSDEASLAPSVIAESIGCPGRPSRSCPCTSSRSRARPGPRPETRAGGARAQP